MSNSRKKQNKPGSKTSAGIQIPKRQPGKATPGTNFMQNLRAFPSLSSHPVDDLLGFSKEENNLDTQNQIISDTQNTISLGTQITANLDNQTSINLDTQNNSHFAPEDLHFEQPTNLILDSQISSIDTLKQNNSGNSDKSFLDYQSNNSEQPEEKTLVIQAPEKEIRAPKSKTELGVRALAEKSLGTQKHEKLKYDYRKYEKNRSTVRVNLHIDKEIDRKVRQYCLIDSHPKVDLKDFYERAALHLLDYLDTQKISDLGAEAPLDDRRLKMLYKTKPFVINLYLAYNTVYNQIVGKSAPTKWKGKWTAKDDELGQTYNEIDPRIVELGILQTQTNKGFDASGSKIQTFKYYTDEIEKCITADVSGPTLDVVLTYHRQVWQKLTGREIELK
jgi:hypothetical protein